MSVVVSTNVASLRAQTNLTVNNDAYQKAMEQLSSGSKINSASDDAAGLSISESIKTQINGGAQALSNIQTARNLMAIAEGGEVTVTTHLQRIRELCVQAASETYTASDKNNILQEIKQRLKDITNIADSTTFNGVKLLDGPTAPATQKSLSIQIGANSDPTVNSIDIGPSLSDVHASVLGGDIRIPDTTTGANWTTANVRAYMDKLDTAITQLTSSRALLGAYGNRMEATSANVTTMNQNLTETNSRILDTDVAQASSTMIKYQILQQTSASILAQANQLPSIALKLLGS